MKSLDEYLEIAFKVSELAGNHALKNFGSQKLKHHKKDLEYGIKEDKECNDIYEDFLKNSTPEVELYTEEGEKNLDSELVWAIDPIDGTSNYSVGIPVWNSQICLLKKGEPVVAVINCPALNQKFHAVKGKGAFLNEQKVSISQITDLKMAVFGISKGNKLKALIWMGEMMRKFFKEIRTPRILSSLGVELSYVASGMIDIFISEDASIWDYAPGVLMIREAGGVVLNMKGEEWTIQDRTLIASNKVLVQKVLKLL